MVQLPLLPRRDLSALAAGERAVRDPALGRTKVRAVVQLPIHRLDHHLNAEVGRRDGAWAAAHALALNVPGQELVLRECGDPTAVGAPHPR
eukprot:14495949-Alexandrium_andersonii.AAC.1